MARNDYLPLFHTKSGKGLVSFRLFAASIFAGVWLILVHRVIHMPSNKGNTLATWAWSGLFLSELWFAFYYLINVLVRWNPAYRNTFKDRLSLRYEKVLPGIDIFVCTADPTVEPPIMVINTVLSVMAYDYPPEKLSVYLSDDGGSDLTFYAMLMASRFAKEWLPFCRKFKVEPRSPEAYFQTAPEPLDNNTLLAKEWTSIKIRVSSRITNAPIILNVDCDMYSSNSESVRDALCFLLDEDKGKEIAYVQFPQVFGNLTKNDVYGSSLRISSKVELHGYDGYGGPCYVGSGCFHRRESLSGKKYNGMACQEDWMSNKVDIIKKEENAHVLEEICKVLASCSYEENTQWGKEMGLKYGCPVEDILTGLCIQYRGWKSVYFNPERPGFLGVAPTTLLQSLVQHKRWSEGDFEIFLRYCPFLYGHKKISLGLQLTYCLYLLLAPNSLATLYYVTVPSLCLLRGISLFPQVLNPWVIPFVYVFFGNFAYSLVEFVHHGGTCIEWLNDTRMWVYRRTTSFLFGFCDNIFKLLGFSKSAFVVTAKVVDEDVSERYEQELMEFGTASPLFTILATLALLNAFVLVWGIKRLLILEDPNINLGQNPFSLQIILCSLLVFINVPLYKALFLRKDKGRMPSSVANKSLVFALAACLLALRY
nr:cellulose synthase-like protein E2 isoform X2 [Ziziphus jujuba var. spinosa]